MGDVTYTCNTWEISDVYVIFYTTLAFSLPELWEMECGSVEDYCLEKNANHCSPVAFRLVSAY